MSGVWRISEMSGGLIFCIVSSQAPNLDPHLHLAAMLRLQLNWTTVKFYFPAGATVYSPSLHPVFFSLQCQIATQEDRHDWHSGELRPVTHRPISVSEGHLFIASPFLLLLLFIPPWILCCGFLNGPESSWSRLLLTDDTERIKSSGGERELFYSHVSWRRSTERSSHAFPFGAGAAGAVGRCLPGSHAALPSRVGPLRRVQVPGLLRWRPDLGLHGLSARGSRHDPVPEGHPGSPKHHLRRPSRDVLRPGECRKCTHFHPKKDTL